MGGNKKCMECILVTGQDERLTAIICPSALTICVIGISESDMLDPTAATELSQNIDRFLHQYQRGYRLGEIKEHALSFTVSFENNPLHSFGQRGCQEVKIDLLLSPYYANQKVLLDNLSRYKSAVERRSEPDLWKQIVQT